MLSFRPSLFRPILVRRSTCIYKQVAVAVTMITGRRWCINLWDITSLGSVQVVVFFDVAARLCAGDGPIAELVGTVRSFLC